MTQTIVRVRPAGVDDYGDPTGEPAETPLTGCFTAPRTSSAVDDEPGRHGVVVGFSLFGPIDTDLERTDQVEVDGELYDIDGDIARWENALTGWKAGFEVALKRAAG